MMDELKIGTPVWYGPWTNTHIYIYCGRTKHFNRSFYTADGGGSTYPVRIIGTANPRGTYEAPTMVRRSDIRPAFDYECRCGKYKGYRYVGIVCDKCGTEMKSNYISADRDDENSHGISFSLSAEEYKRLTDYARHVTHDMNAVAKQIVMLSTFRTNRMRAKHAHMQNFEKEPVMCYNCAGLLIDIIGIEDRKVCTCTECGAVFEIPAKR